MAYRDDRWFAAAVVWDIESATVVSSSHASGKVEVGYVPGFLGFREGPMVAALARKIAGSADVFLVDGHGQVHPRRLSLACHVGLALQRPTIGVASLSSMVGRKVRTLLVRMGSCLGRWLRLGEEHCMSVSAI